MVRERDRRNDVVSLFYPFKSGKNSVTTVFFPWKDAGDLDPARRFRVRQRFGFTEAELQLGETELPPRRDSADNFNFMKVDFMRRLDIEQVSRELYDEERVVYYAPNKAFLVTRDPRDKTGKITVSFASRYSARENRLYELVQSHITLALSVMEPLERARELIFEAGDVGGETPYRIRQRLGFTEPELHLGSPWVPYNPKEVEGKTYQKPDFIRKSELQALLFSLFEEGNILYEASSRTFTAVVDPRDPNGTVEVKFSLRGVEDSMYYISRSQIDLVLKCMVPLQEAWALCYKSSAPVKAAVAEVQEMAPVSEAEAVSSPAVETLPEPDDSDEDEASSPEEAMV